MPVTRPLPDPNAAQLASVILANGMGVVLHGTNPSVRRPVEFRCITWIGSVQPLNAYTTDRWIDTTGEGRDALEVDVAPVIETDQEEEGEFVVGDELSLTTAGTYTGEGDETLSYQWVKSLTDDGEGLEDIYGETDPDGFVVTQDQLDYYVALKEIAQEPFGDLEPVTQLSNFMGPFATEIGPPEP